MDKEHEAISRLQLASKMSERYYNQPLLICNSGGKDSLVCLELARRAGIDYEMQHSHTTADMPDTVYYVRKQMRDLELQGIKCTINYPTYKGKRISMWSLIPLKDMPPTRFMRYCCAVLKETTGANRAIVTGVRAKESVKRSKRKYAETMTAKMESKVYLDFDDISELFERSENRQFVEHDKKFLEHCKIKGKTIFNPIIDWTDEDVWEFVESENLEINPCYKRYNLERCGCVGCPMAGKKRWKEFALFPKYRDMYLMAFKEMLAVGKAEGKETAWKDEWDVFFWWMEDKKEKKDKKDKDLIPGQISLF